MTTEMFDATPLSPIPADLPDDPIALEALISAAMAKRAELTYTACTEHQLTELAYQREHNRRLADTADVPLLVEISDRAAYQQAGFRNFAGFLTQGLQLSAAESRRRRLLAEAVGTFTALHGEPLPPRCPAAAAALKDGTITADHVLEIFKTLQKIPHTVDDEQRSQAEADLAHAATTLTPEQTRMVGRRLLDYLDPDGDLTDETDRQRNRGLTLSHQDQQLMTKLSGTLTPALRAMLEVVLTTWAAPGMNNPDDPDSPTGPVDAEGLDPERLDAARARDRRSPAQRNHDALMALCRFAMGHRALGNPHRLPAELVITTTDAELAKMSGIALTATGTHVPLSELVSLAADAACHLAVFAEHTAEVLYLGRARFANKAQRLAMFARDRGCTKPGCSRPFAQCEGHHADTDYADGGRTDINTLGGACGGDNRVVGKNPGDWETTVLRTGPDRGRIAWRVVGSGHGWRVNPIHHIGLPHRHNPGNTPNPTGSEHTEERRGPHAPPDTIA